MHQNRFLTTQDGQKYLFSENFSVRLEVSEDASKHLFNHSRSSKTSLLKNRFW
jgi:hypothetical protein